VFLGLLIGIILLIRFFIRKNKNISQGDDIKQEQIVNKIEKIECSECKAENNADSKYCTRCGFELPKTQ